MFTIVFKCLQFRKFWKCLEIFRAGADQIYWSYMYSKKLMMKSVKQYMAGSKFDKIIKGTYNKRMYPIYYFRW